MDSAFICDNNIGITLIIEQTLFFENRISQKKNQLFVNNRRSSRGNADDSAKNNAKRK